MSKQYFEAHITLEAAPENREYVRKLVEGTGWKFSCIDGDPVMGAGVKMYATTHWNTRIGAGEAVERLREAAVRLEFRDDRRAVTITRRKVELVLYDDRSSKVGACDGACPECHLEDLKNV